MKKTKTIQYLIIDILKNTIHVNTGKTKQRIVVTRE
jgi:hypothetical protein